jgi:hypothetical protein
MTYPIKIGNSEEYISVRLHACGDLSIVTHEICFNSAYLEEKLQFHVATSIKLSLVFLYFLKIKRHVMFYLEMMMSIGIFF